MKMHSRTNPNGNGFSSFTIKLYAKIKENVLNFMLKHCYEIYAQTFELDSNMLRTTLNIQVHYCIKNLNLTTEHVQ